MCQLGGFLSGLVKEITQNVTGEKDSNQGLNVGGPSPTTYVVKSYHSESVPAGSLEIAGAYSEK